MTQTTSHAQAAQRCLHADCPAYPAKPDAYPRGWETRLCLEHSMAEYVRRDHRGAYRPPHMSVDAAMYSQWVQDVVSARAITYRGVTLPGMTQNRLTWLTGVSQSILSRLGNGKVSTVSRSTAMSLDPWLATRPGATQRDRVAAHRHVPTPAVAHRLPYRAIMVDSRGVAWQRMTDRFKAVPDPRNLSASPNYPCKLLWLPPGKTPSPGK